LRAENIVKRCGDYLRVTIAKRAWPASSSTRSASAAIRMTETLFPSVCRFANEQKM
jgi:hypothetical protein